MRADLTIMQVADPNSGMVILNFNMKRPGWVIKSVIIFNEVLFEGSDSIAVHPQQST
jgi:hypothetical protein